MVLKVGDRVKILNKIDRYNDHLKYITIGGFYTIIGLGAGTVGIKNNNGEVSQFFEGDHPGGMKYFLELADEEFIYNKPSVAERIKDIMLDIKIGQHTILGQDKIKSQMEVAINKNTPVLLIGDTGTGKTTLVKELADKYSRKWLRFNLTGETTVDEFVGKYTLRDNNTVWEDGVLLTAMKQGYWFIVDEVNVALPEILFVLHSLLDDDKSVLVSNHLGEIVKPHKNFRFFGTMNPVEEYAGTKDLNKAFKSRFGMILVLEYPIPTVESTIVHYKGGVEMDIASEIVDTAVAIRKAKNEGKVYYTCSTRDLIHWAILSDDLGLNDAFTVSIVNKADNDGPEIVKLYQQKHREYEDLQNSSIITTNLELIKELAYELENERKIFEKDKQKLELVKDQIIDKTLEKKAKLTKNEVSKIAKKAKV